MSEKEEAFFKDLEELFRKHRMTIEGCGCCSSPYAVNLDRAYPVIETPEAMEKRIKSAIGSIS